MQDTSAVLDPVIEPALKSASHEDETVSPKMGSGSCSECDCQGFHRGDYPDTCKCGHSMNLHY